MKEKVVVVMPACFECPPLGGQDDINSSQKSRQIIYTSLESCEDK
jgi:hypothetical protein